MEDIEKNGIFGAKARKDIKPYLSPERLQKIINSNPEAYKKLVA